MPIPNTPKPLFPNIPAYPGVPPLPQPPGAGLFTPSTVLLVSDAVGVLSLFLGPQWGLFTADGAPAFSAIPGLSGLGGLAAGVIGSAISLATGIGLSIGSFEYRKDNRISTAPQEQGAFLSYNNVSDPFRGQVTYIVSGLAGIRGAFVAAVQAAQAALTLYSLVMPEYTFQSCKIIHNDLRRTAKDGVSMFGVDIWVEEVRITGTAAYSNTAQPSAADPVNGGTVQPQTTTPSQTPPAIPSAGGALVPPAGIS